MKKFGLLLLLWIGTASLAVAQMALPIANASSTGTTLNTLTKLTGAPSTAVISTAGDTSGVIGICAAGCGTSGTSTTATIVTWGIQACVFDNTTTAGHYVQISASVNGDCTDAGATRPTSGQVIGRVLASGAAGTYNVDLYTAETFGGVGTMSDGAGTTTAGKIPLTTANAHVMADTDFPERFYVPAANCNNTTAGAGWSIGSGGTVTCRAGTNNKGGYISITDTSSTFAQFTVTIPEDWDSATNPYIRFFVATADTTSSHTIIPAIQVSCSKGDGSTTDDVSFNASHSSSTITTNTTANQFWSNSNVQMNSTDMTGCVAGAQMIVQVGRATDTATSAYFYGADITFPRLLTVQAN